ncbi:MAG: heparinase II/III family protein, partial [bacterium]|nr:heparinase II/III family protein [bacterium]
LMAARFNLPEYRALLAELLEGPVAETGGEYALFHRESAFSVRPGDRVVLEDVFFPALRMGYFRLGAGGRKGTVILDASHWGGHHHRDSLNLTLFQEGHEVLTDLGYLWDRPDKEMTVRTAAHNLVVVDEAEQETKGRKGSLHLFDATDRVKVMACSSEAYPQASLYRRTCIQVDHGKDGCYFVDLFHVVGGEKHDYLFHGPIPAFREEGISLENTGKEGPYGIRNVQGGTPGSPWRLSWQMDPDVLFSAWTLPDEGEQVLIGEGWGERGWGHFNAEDKKADIPYVIRRREGTELSSLFVSVFEVHRGEGLVTGMKRLSVEGEGVALEVETRFGKDVLLASLVSGSGKCVRASGGMLETDGFLVVASEDFLYAAGGTYARSGNMEVNPVPNVQGTVRSFENGNEDSFFVVGKISDAQVLVGQMVLVDDGESTTGYRVQDVEVLSSDTRIYTKKNGIGYDLGGGATWSVVGAGLTV